jgi:hypothetical protein
VEHVDTTVTSKGVYMMSNKFVRAIQLGTMTATKVGSLKCNVIQLD